MFISILYYWSPPSSHSIIICHRLPKCCPGSINAIHCKSKHTISVTGSSWITPLSLGFQTPWVWRYLDPKKPCPKDQTYLSRYDWKTRVITLNAQMHHVFWCCSFCCASNGWKLSCFNQLHPSGFTPIPICSMVLETILTTHRYFEMVLDKRQYYIRPGNWRP